MAEEIPAELTDAVEQLSDDGLVQVTPASAPEDATVSALYGLLSRAHALAVLEAVVAGEGPQRFGELSEAVDAPPNTLSERLTAFEEAGLISRTVHDEVPRRVEYAPTASGEALAPLFGYLRLWARHFEVEG